MTLRNALALANAVAFLAFGGSLIFTKAMTADFARFGLERFRVTTGVLEVLGGVGVLIGLRWAPALRISLIGLSAIMLAGVVVRLRSGDALVEMAPAALLLALNGYLAAGPTTR